MVEIQNELWPEDQELFEKMKDNYISDDEKKFFETLHERQETQLAVAGDFYMLPEDNEERIGLMRCEYEEWILYVLENKKQIHVMNLSECLNVKLLDLGIDKNISIFQWLRAINYKGVRYDYNMDLM